MIVELPEWQPFSAGDSPWMPELTDAGRVVVALAPAPSTREQWSAQVVLDLLDMWSDSGHRVVLADCVLEHPTLHRSAGLSNGEGLVDAALFGASVSRVARPVPGRAFFFVGAGSPTGDAETVLASPRLDRLRQGFRDAGVTFVAFVRQGCVGEAALVEAADDVLILAAGSGQVPGGVRGAEDKVRAVVGPAGETPAPVDPDASVETDLPVEIESAPEADPVAEHAPMAEEGADAGADAGPTPEDDDIVGGLDLTLEPDPGAEQPADETHAAPDAVDSFVPDELSAPVEVSSPDPEPVMDFVAQEEDGDDDPEPGTEAYAPEVEPAGAPAAPARTRRAQRGADPDARKKLLWVALAVLVLVVLVVLGALGE